MPALDDAEIIANNPIRNGLDDFRQQVHRKCEELSISVVEDLLKSTDFTTLALELIIALQSVPCSRILPSRTGRGSLLQDLFKLGSQIDASVFPILSLLPLVERVYIGASDQDIYNALFTLVARPVTPIQPLPSLHSFQQTPWTFNTGSFADTSDLRKHVDPILKSEVEDNLRVDHPKFFDTFFGQILGLDDLAVGVLQACKDAKPPLYQDGVGWLKWPESCEESAVLDFLHRHVAHFLHFAETLGFQPTARRRCVTTPNKPIPGSVSKRKLDVGFAYCFSNHGEEDTSHLDWSRILIPGELKSNAREDNYSSTWLDLLRYAREVFGAQGTRRFVLGFTLCGPVMRLWEFDRLGGVASLPIDVHDDGHMFVSAILGYLWMNEEELGFDPTVAEEDGCNYTEIYRNNNSQRLRLAEIIKRQRSVAGRATTCWKAWLSGDQATPVVIKDSWEYEERPEEGLLLKEATEAGVKNIAQYYHHETVHVGGAIDDVCDNVRKGLSNTAGRNAFQRRRIVNSEATTTLEASEDSEQQRRRSISKNGTRKRSTSGTSTPMPPSKRSCSDSPVKQHAKQHRNRVHRRLIMSDIGKSIYHASSPQAILTGLLGGIKGHESLLHANILHRDISVGNVMLENDESDGFLIDLDLAIKIDRTMASGAPSKTGTKVFMAIGTLYGEEHNFMHDLESFFWVLFWLCVHWTGPGEKRSKTEYELWNYEPTKKLAEIKKGKVDEDDKFTKEVNENFTAHCKSLIPCVQELRRVVFPGGKRWLKEDRSLYSQIRAVLEKARKH